MTTSIVVAVLAACVAGCASAPPRPAVSNDETQHQTATANQTQPNLAETPPPVVPPSPPSPILARIVKVETTGSSDMGLTVNAGSEDGVAKSWSACMIDSADNCRPEVDLVVIRVDKHTTVLRSSVTKGPPTGAIGIRLTPP